MRRVTYDNVLPVGLFVRWGIIVGFIGLLGLCFVHMKHNLKVDGDRCRELEMAINDLDEKLKVASNEVMRLTSRPALERRRQEGFIQMVQVQDGRLVRLRVQTSAAAALPVDHREDSLP
jgi:hypothetical protein